MRINKIDRRMGDYFSKVKPGHILWGRRLNCTLVGDRWHRRWYQAPRRSLPSSVDLRPQMIPVRDQGQEGSCTSFGHGGNADWRQLQGNHVMKFHPTFKSAACNFFYGQERTIDGDFSSDAGSQVATGAQVATTVGFISEEVFPYSPSTLYQEPSAIDLLWAKTHRLTSALPIDLTDETAIMGALANNDPVVFGWQVYASIQEVGSDGILPMPGWFDTVEGGHCTVVMGYKIINGKLYFIVRNSWGSAWADNGYFYMPAAYITDPNLASDGWVIK